MIMMIMIIMIMTMATMKMKMVTCGSDTYKATFYSFGFGRSWTSLLTL